jgi:hypothetical protein
MVRQVREEIEEKITTIITKLATNKRKIEIWLK